MRNSKLPSLDIKKKTVYKLTKEEQSKVHGGGNKTQTTVIRTSYQGK
jgi:hypothetical protein